MNKQDAYKILKNEKLTTEEIAELSWILNSHLYKERPVTIEQFYSSDDFVHKKWPNIFPLWKKTLKEIFPTPFNSPYNEILISAAAGCVDKQTEVLTENGWIFIDQYKNENIAVFHEDGNITYERPIEYIHGKVDTWYHFKNAFVDMKLSAEHTVCFYENGKLSQISALELSKLDKEIDLPTPAGLVKLNGKKQVVISPAGPFELKYCFRTSTSMWIMRRNNKVLITCNSGKTVTATISVLYDMYKLGCLKDPCSFYGLTPDTMIIMAIFSATGATAAVNWNDITTGIENCPWMMDKLVDKRGLEKKHGSIVPVEILPGIYIQTGSKFQHSMGKAIFDGLMDEAAFGGSNMKDAQKSYSELSSRMKTRFSTYSERGNLPGQLFLISSPKEAGDFMQYRIEETKKADAKLTKIMMNISSWDSNPNNDSDEKFTVFIGNESKEPCIYEPDQDVPIEEMDYLIYPPMRYYEEFKKDLLISIMNYGGITTTSDMALFKSPTVLNDVFVLNNPFQKDVIELPFAKADKQLIDYCDLEFFKNIRHPEYNRFIHLDAAFSTNTLDVYGLAASYCIQTDNEIINASDEDTDVFTKKDRMYFTDFVVGITAPKGQEVPLYKVQDFIEYIIKNLGYPVASISADQFQSKQTLQNLRVKGFETENISVDRTRDPYLFLRMLVHNKQILMAKNMYVRDEFKKLRDDGKKIDHPVNFHKDLADAICGSIWNCANSNDIVNKVKVTQQALNPNTYEPQELQSLEMMEFERLKQQYASGIFKNF